MQDKGNKMHLYYFNLGEKGTLRVVTESPLQVSDENYIYLDIDIEGHALKTKVPSEMCFYFDGAMCLYTAPKEIVALVDKATDTLDDVALFMSGFQKFLAPILGGLSAEEKVKFRNALYSLNTYQEFSEDTIYTHFMVTYLEIISDIQVIGNDFDPKLFLNAIRKGKN